MTRWAVRGTWASDQRWEGFSPSWVTWEKLGNLPEPQLYHL